MANPPMTDSDIVAVVQAAILGERERCAKLVEGLGKVSSNDLIWAASKTVAAEIRKVP